MTAVVSVDFNDLGRDPAHLWACYPGHVKGGPLAEGDEVWLDDGEGTRCRGLVDKFENFGRGDLVVCHVLPGSFEDYSKERQQ